jgi:DNA-binding transcriptional ArsR family regulator
VPRVSKCGCSRTKTRIRQVSSMSPITNMSPDNETWDPSYLRLDRTGVPQLNDRHHRGRQASPIRDKFIAGPVDVSWVCRAGRLGVKALLVGLALWHLRGLRRSNSFIVSNLMMHEWGVQPDAKARALRKLEKARLATVKRQGKRSPRVTLVVGNSSYGGRRSTRGYRSRKDAAQRCGSFSRFQGRSSTESVAARQV